MFGFRRRARLTDKAYYIREMDLAYLKEGVDSMTLDELRNVSVFLIERTCARKL